MLPRNPPEILRRARVALHSLMAHCSEAFLESQATLRQHAHGAEGDGGESDTSAEQLTIAFPQVFTRTIVNRSPSIRQAEWCVDRDKRRASLFYEAKNVLVAE